MQGEFSVRLLLVGAVVVVVVVMWGGGDRRRCRFLGRGEGVVGVRHVVRGFGRFGEGNGLVAKVVGNRIGILLATCC